jgi:hypothetical protein
VKIQTPLSDGNKKGVLIKAHGDLDAAANTVPVFIGNAQVTTSDGFSLGPGESVTLPVEGDDIYAIAGSASQKVSWAVV